MSTIRTIYEQQKYMYDHHTHSVSDRIVSVSQPFVRPEVRGKVGKPVEFGIMLDISVVDGWTRLEYHSFDAYNEAKNLQEMAERFYQREGHYPARILADKIYHSRENLSYCKVHGIRLSGPALALAFILVSNVYSSLGNSNIIKMLNCISYEMYLYHGLMIYLLQRIVHNGYLFLVLAFVTTVGVSIVAKRANKVLVEYLLKKFIAGKLIKIESNQSKNLT